MKQIKNQAKGFTIIEVVLVLAIAGLIFLMVFIALPALQRNQRDTQRREDVGRFMSQLEQYRTNNRGSTPSSASSFVSSYLQDFKDPKTDSPYVLKTAMADVTGGSAGDYYYAQSATCEAEKVVSLTPTTNNRQAAMAMKLEGSGVYCQTNQ